MSDGTAKPELARKERYDAPQREKKAATAHLDNHIGRELRQLYASVLEEPIPERFLTLLQTLESDHEKPKDGADA
jgi:hypothetical protein